MKPLKTIALTAIILMLMGCSQTELKSEPPAAHEQQTAKVSVVGEQSEQPKVSEEQTATTTPTATPSKVVTPELQKLLEKSFNIQSLQYYFIPSTEVSAADTYYWKGDKVKIKFYEPSEIKHPDTYYDTAYIDLAENKGIGVCESRKMCKVVNKTFVITPKDVVKKMPLEWMMDARQSDWIVLEQGEETLYEILVRRVRYKYGDKETKMWLHNYYGVPVKVIDSEGGVWIYKRMAANHLTDKDLEWPRIEQR